jgi:hypothetical protein
MRGCPKFKQDALFYAAPFELSSLLGQRQICVMVRRLTNQDCLGLKGSFYKGLKAFTSKQKSVLTEYSLLPCTKGTLQSSRALQHSLCTYKKRLEIKNLVLLATSLGTCHALELVWKRTKRNNVSLLFVVLQASTRIGFKAAKCLSLLTWQKAAGCRYVCPYP